VNEKILTTRTFWVKQFIVMVPTNFKLKVTRGLWQEYGARGLSQPGGGPVFCPD
jgi:hypothetical protein